MHKRPEHHPRRVASDRRFGARLSLPWSAVLCILFLAAWAWRLFYLERLKTSPLWGSFHADAGIYWEWATSLLQHDFRGSNPFFFGPLYPYLLAVLRDALGNSVGAALLVQTLWGAASVVLLADAAKRLTTPVFGALLGILVAGYEMAVFFDGLILMESLLFCLESLLLWLVVRANWNPPSVKLMVALGVLIGILAQGRATAVLFLVPAALCMSSALRWSRAAAARVALLVGSCLLVAVPSTVHNRIVAHEWIPFTYSLGYNLYVGNNPGATGSFVVTTGMMEPFQPVGERPAEGGVAGDGRAYLRLVEGRDLSPSQSSRYWASRAVGFAKEHPVQALRLAVQKALMFWNWREYAQVESINVFRTAVGPVGLPALGTFAFLAVLGFAGWRRTWEKGLGGRFVVGYVLTMTVSIAPFFVTDRYRLHLVPGVALLAGVGLEHLLRHTHKAERIRLVAALLLGVIVVALPMPGSDRARLAWDTSSDLGRRWLERGRPDLARDHLERAVQIDQAGQLRGATTATARLARADVYGDYATALMRLRQPEQAVVWYERAYQLAPEQSNASALAIAYAMTGSVDRSRRLFAQLGVSGDSAAEVLLREAATADKTGRQSEVEHLLKATIALDSTRTIAWVALVRLHVQLEHFDKAQQTLRQAKEAGLGESVFFAHEAFIAASRGDLAHARRALMRVSPSAEATDPSFKHVLAFVRAKLGDPTSPTRPLPRDAPAPR